MRPSTAFSRCAISASRHGEKSGTETKLTIKSHIYNLERIPNIISMREVIFMVSAEPGDQDDASRLRQGLEALLDNIRQAADTVHRCPGAEPADLAEGYLNLLGALTATIRRSYAASDPAHPRFVLLADDFTRGAFSNPDNQLFCADIAGGHAYRIAGTRGDCADMAFELSTGLAGYGGGDARSLAFIDTDQIDVDADGHFEIWLGGPERTRNWLPNPPQARHLLVRFTFADWRGDLPRLTIERTGDPAGEPDYARPNAGSVAALMSEVGERLAARISASGQFAAAWHASLPLNQLTPPMQRGDGYLPKQFSTQCRFQLAPDEALLIEVEPTDARYQSICLGNRCWLESFDIRETQSSLTTAQSRLSDDGIYRYVVSLADPGVANWLDPAGHREGFIFMRWQGISGPPPRQPGTRVVPLRDLPAELAASGEPMPGRGERLRARRQRRLLIDRRYP